LPIALSGLVDASSSVSYSLTSQTATGAQISPLREHVVTAAYDLMSVVLGFSLSANSNVGLSGSVQQNPVPLPAAAWLLGSAVLGLAGLSRRRQGLAPVNDVISGAFAV
jgi:hypothetical protein